MKYISLILDLLLVFGLWALAIDYLAKDLRTFWIIFLLLGLDRLDIANLYFKKNGGNRNENKKS